MDVELAKKLKAGDYVAAKPNNRVVLPGRYELLEDPLPSREPTGIVVEDQVLFAIDYQGNGRHLFSSRYFQ
ncbi:MAG: hypothetical protein J4473_04845 [Candidatus Aenigmarchaeota archaeon]|nr:hypothetical protein [Candidatus Aenigmarchaeota archaeon]